MRNFTKSRVSRSSDRIEGFAAVGGIGGVIDVLATRVETDEARILDAVRLPPLSRGKMTHAPSLPDRAGRPARLAHRFRPAVMLSPREWLRGALADPPEYCHPLPRCRSGTSAMTCNLPRSRTGSERSRLAPSATPALIGMRNDAGIAEQRRRLPRRRRVLVRKVPPHQAALFRREMLHVEQAPPPSPSRAPRTTAADCGVVRGSPPARLPAERWSPSPAPCPAPGRRCGSPGFLVGGIEIARLHRRPEGPHHKTPGGSGVRWKACPSTKALPVTGHLRFVVAGSHLR